MVEVTIDDDGRYLATDNWSVVHGVGNTQEEAMLDYKVSLDEYLALKGKPGTSNLIMSSRPRCIVCKKELDFEVNEWDRFIDDNIYCSDDGTYELGSKEYRQLKKKLTKRVGLKELFDTFEKEIKKGKGHFSFRVFA